MPLRPGDMVGSYEIVSLLGQGGMATVYRAYHARLNRQVAIKMIHPTYLDDQSWIARFEREAQIIAALEHPNIVPVYDFSEHAGEPYLVMKLIEGSTLKAMLANGALRIEDILSIAAPVAQALDYAHGQGVLHRDIKPSNLMLDRQMTPYLTDFGLARIAVAGDSTISKDMLMGTPYYIAPEQALKNGKVDYRADLYSFGVVLYELLVGKVPFSSGTPYSIINDHVTEPLPMPSSLNPEIPPAVEMVLLKALAKDPDDRYDSAAAMVEELRRSVQASTPQIMKLSAGASRLPSSVVEQVTPPPGENQRRQSHAEAQNERAS
ncbi:MAG: serine/threonine-protein kinase [Anaerolineae bacterium]